MKNPLKSLKRNQNSSKNPKKIHLFPDMFIRRLVIFFDPNYDKEVPIQYFYKEWTRRSVTWVAERYLTGFFLNLIFHYFLKMEMTWYSIFIYGLTIYYLIALKEKIWR